MTDAGEGLRSTRHVRENWSISVTSELLTKLQHIFKIHTYCDRKLGGGLNFVSRKTKDLRSHISYTL